MSNADRTGEVDIEEGEGKIMEHKYNAELDRVFGIDEFKQFNRLNQNTNSRIPIFFCIDVSGSMATRVGIFESRLSILSKVMIRLLENMMKHPVLSERAVIGIVTYNNKAVLYQSALDLGVVNIKNATSFTASNQTVLSLGLRRTLQAIDRYRDDVRRSDVETFTPMLVFMTDGYPVGDSDNEIRSVYQEIWKRVQNNDLYVFPIGISRDANMDYVYALTPDHRGYQMIKEKDFDNVFSEIEKIADDKPTNPVEEWAIKTPMASGDDKTLDTGSGESIALKELAEIINRRT